MTIAGMPKTIDAPRQPTAAMSGAPDDRDHDRPDVAAGDVGADGEAPTFRRELLGEEAVADRDAAGAADPRRPRWPRRTSGTRSRQRLGDEAAAEQETAGAEDPSPRRPAG